MRGKLQSFLGRETARRHALHVPIQVLATLDFLATGALQRELTGTVLVELSHFSFVRRNKLRSAICNKSF